MPNIQFATQSYKLPSLPLSAQRCVNMYAERAPQDAKSQIPVIGLHGLQIFAVAGNGPIRGMHVMNSLLYAVSGQQLYSITSAGVATNVSGGVSIAGTGVVSMADNGTQLAIVNGNNGFIYTTGGGLVQISDPNFHAANTVTFFDNYFVFDWAGTNKYFISNILDGTTYSGLDFASAEVQPQIVLSIVNQQENLLLFTTGHIETWYDSGAVNFPFQRYDGATIERGATGFYTTIKEDNSVFFLGDDLIFYRLNGIIPVRISTHALEYEWQTYATTSDAFCFSYSWGGHKFIVLTFPTAMRTFVFDISTNLWHERESWDTNNHTYGRWRGNCHVTAYGKELIGDFITGNVGSLSTSVYTEYGNIIPATLVSPPIHSDRKRIFHSRFELDMETGVGTPTSLPVYNITGTGAGAANVVQLVIGAGDVASVAGINTGDTVVVSEVVGTTEANGTWVCDVVIFGSLGRVNLRNTLFQNAYVSGGGLTDAAAVARLGPQAMLDWSNDGGRTFGPLQIWNSMGQIGQYLTRLRWLRLGNARQRIYRLTITDPVKRILIAAHADLSVGM